MIASSRPPERRLLKRRTLVPIELFSSKCVLFVLDLKNVSKHWHSPSQFQDREGGFSAEARNSMKECKETLHCKKKSWLYAKIRAKYKKLIKILRFKNFKNLRFFKTCLTEIKITHSIFKVQKSFRGYKRVLKMG